MENGPPTTVHDALCLFDAETQSGQDAQGRGSGMHGRATATKRHKRHKIRIPPFVTFAPFRGHPASLHPPCGNDLVSDPTTSDTGFPFALLFAFSSLLCDLFAPLRLCVMHPLTTDNQGGLAVIRLVCQNRCASAARRRASRLAAANSA